MHKMEKPNVSLFSRIMRKNSQNIVSENLYSAC